MAAPTPAPAAAPAAPARPANPLAGTGIVRTKGGLTSIIGDLSKLELLSLQDLQEVARIRRLPILNPPTIEMGGSKEKTQNYAVVDTEARIAYVVYVKTPG